MDENILRLRVGIFVLIAMIILAILIFLNSEGWGSQYTLIVKPFKAPGVTVGTPVRKNGILIGRVRSVIPEDGYVTIEMGINDDIRIYENEVCAIGAESILGDTGIEFVSLRKSERGEPVKNMATVGQFTLKADPMDFVKTFNELAPQLREALTAIQGAGRSIDEAGKGVNKLTEQLNSVFSDESSELKGLITDFRDTNRKAQAAIDNFNRIFENANGLIGDPEFKGQLRQAIAEVPEIFREVRSMISDTRDTITKFQSIPDKVSGTLDGLNTTIDNVEVFSSALKENGPEVVAQLNKSLKNIDELVVQVKTFASGLGDLKDSKGTLGLLLNDPELYETALETVANVNRQITKIEGVLNDIRVFSDKIARKPGELGISGAIDGFKNKNDYKGSAGRDGGLFRSGRSMR